VNQDEFDKLLSWLDIDRDCAGEKYEVIRRGLIKIFVRRGCPTAEELADETIERVCQKLSRIVDNYIGDPEPYFYGVARNIYLEYLKRKTALPSLPPNDAFHKEELQYQCLDQCLGKLDEGSRELIISFYQMEKRAKIDHRKELARRLKITVHALRMRALRIRDQLQECINECLDGN
jgi:RNA polymerase sigma factor (sigma-70 family)